MLTSLERLARTQVKGYIDFDPVLRVGGLLFNKVGGEAHTRWMADAITSAGLGLRVLGGIPKVRGSGAGLGIRAGNGQASTLPGLCSMAPTKFRVALRSTAPEAKCGAAHARQPPLCVFSSEQLHHSRAAPLALRRTRAWS